MTPVQAFIVAFAGSLLGSSLAIVASIFITQYAIKRAGDAAMKRSLAQAAVIEKIVKENTTCGCGEEWCQACEQDNERAAEHLEREGIRYL